MEIPTLDMFPRRVLAAIDIQRVFTRLIVAAEKLQVFRALPGKRIKAASIGRALKIHKSYRDTFLNSLVSLGLLHKADDTYWNTRIRTLPGDMRQGLPAGYDVIMFCDIGPVSRQLLRSAYKSLPTGGLIVAVDRYPSADGTRPLDRVVAQFVSSSFLPSFLPSGNLGRHCGSIVRPAAYTAICGSSPALSRRLGLDEGQLGRNLDGSYSPA